MNMGKVQTNIDGVPIDYYEGRFGGAFSLPEEVAEELAYDDTVGFLVIGTLSKAAVSSLKNGDTKRVNTFEVIQASALSAEDVAEFGSKVGLDLVPDPPTNSYEQTSIYGEED
jgi:hypothetical protein